MDMRNRIIISLIVMGLLAADVAGEPRKTRSKSRSKARTEQTRSKKPARPESRSELQRQQQTTQQEIKETRQKIKENDRAVSRNLAELGKLEGDINATRSKVAESSRRVRVLENQMGKLSGSIDSNEKELARMRSEYLKSLKKIRSKKGTSSNLAYIFSSRSFSEARRRMRYLKEFAAWRDKQTQLIGSKVNELQSQRAQLAQGKKQHDKELSARLSAQRALEGQYRQKDAIVVQLKANGAALKDHLARKQAEVNNLRSRVAALIAEEQRIAAQREAEQRAAEQRAAEKRAAEQRAAEEKQRQQQLAEERAERERELQEQQERKESEDKAARKRAEKEAKEQKSKAEKARKEREKQEKARAEKARKEQEKKKNNSGEKKSTESGEVSYAEARRRRPRGKNVPPAQTVESSKTTAKAAGSKSGNFASMRGSLPRPVSGSFKITSRFGRQSLPDLSNVMYDNPGIDAEVAKGATAQAVYGGRVSGVYMIPGFSTVVIINHGGYYTVYGNLSSASVKVGDVVKQGQGVGRVAEDEDRPSVGKIHFEVWKNRDKQNPEAWIR